VFESFLIVDDVDFADVFLMVPVVFGVWVYEARLSRPIQMKSDKDLIKIAAGRPDAD